MWNGKNKAVTFSYDDGVEQDIRLIQIFNRYGMKCTFNLNSGLMNDNGCWITADSKRINRMKADSLPELYKGHEIAVHCLTHANLTELDDNSVKKEILEDKSNLERIFGCKINGMAYPYGAYDMRIMQILKECGIKYCRTTEDTHNFELPENLLAYGSSCHHSYENIFGMAEEFLNYKGEKPAVFCIWGHSYEFYLENNWERIEKLCSMLSGHDDVFYGTNSEVYLGI